MEEEHRHLQRRRELDEIQTRDLSPHRVHGEPEAAPPAGQLDDRDSCAPRTARPTFQRARGRIAPSKRDTQVRSVNTALAG
jgi:hypothetical protein